MSVLIGLALAGEAAVAAAWLFAARTTRRENASRRIRALEAENARLDRLLEHQRRGRATTQW